MHASHPLGTGSWTGLMSDLS